MLNNPPIPRFFKHMLKQRTLKSVIRAWATGLPVLASRST